MKKENVSTVFMLPGIEISDKLKNEFYSFGFENTFLTCAPLTYPFEVLYILFQPKVVDMDFIRFAEELHKNPNFIETIDTCNGGVLMVYRVPKKFRRDYELFLEGKYSRMSSDFKKCFLMEQFKLDPVTHKPIKDGMRYIKEPTDFFHIFNRTDELKSKWMEILGYDEDDKILDDMELYDIQNPVKETLEEELWLG